MVRNRLKAKGRRPRGRFASIPHAVLEHDCYTTLTHKSVRLLLDLSMQYNGHNNGDLSAAWGIMCRRGWKSRDTLDAAIRELVEHSLIVRSRQGGRNRCNLYALTWEAVDECRGKLDIQSTRTPLGDWQQWTPTAICHARHSGEVSPAIGQSDVCSAPAVARRLG